MMDGKSNSVSRAAKDEAELAKNPWTLSDLGMQLMPDLLSKTPPYIESVFADSPVGKSGLRPDDLVMFVGDKLVRSLQDLRNELRKVENADDISITVLRNQQLIPVNISPEFDDK
jgi:serine protease Do